MGNVGNVVSYRFGGIIIPDGAQYVAIRDCGCVDHIHIRHPDNQHNGLRFQSIICAQCGVYIQWCAFVEARWA